MKGFSRKETVAFYQDIMERAWKQIETAGTPEVKSQMYDESLEWTMLDKNYDERTRRVFTGPVFVPMWWGRYDPGYHPVCDRSRPPPVSMPASGGRSSVSLPGSAFAASVVTGVQGFSSKVLGDVNTFTSGVTNNTNPVPCIHEQRPFAAEAAGIRVPAPVPAPVAPAPALVVDGRILRFRLIDCRFEFIGAEWIL